jgi:hypothetical protein
MLTQSKWAGFSAAPSLIMLIRGPINQARFDHDPQQHYHQRIASE